jgi:hypothetical protein
MESHAICMALQAPLEPGLQGMSHLVRIYLPLGAATGERERAQDE